jgi:hypothetical protein
MRRIFVEGTDDHGRSFKAVGESVSRLAILIPGVHGVCWKSLVRFEINGIEAWGEDQDAWPLNMWSAYRRAQKGLQDIRNAELDNTLTKFEFSRSAVTATSALRTNHIQQDRQEI